MNKPYGPTAVQPFDHTAVQPSYSRILSNDFRLGHGDFGFLGLLFRSWARFGALLGAVGRSFGVPRVFCGRPWPVRPRFCSPGLSPGRPGHRFWRPKRGNWQDFWRVRGLCCIASFCVRFSCVFATAFRSSERSVFDHVVIVLAFDGSRSCWFKTS